MLPRSDQPRLPPPPWLGKNLSRNYSVVLEPGSLFRPKGPEVQIARAIGPGAETKQTLKAQRADSSISYSSP